MADDEPGRPHPLLELLPADEFDPAQAEVWASGVVASVDHIDAVIDWLAHEAPPSRGGAVLAALAAIAGDSLRQRANIALDGLDIGAHQWSAFGTARAESARVFATADATVVAVAWRHDDETTHTMLTEIEVGSDSQVRVVAVRFGRGDLIEALRQEEGLSRFSSTDITLEDARDLIGRALARPVCGDDETWANATVATARYQALGVDANVRFEPPPEAHPGVLADAEAARHSVELMTAALRDADIEPASRADHELVMVAIERVRPIDITGCSAAEAAAIVHLEWADWIGAIIGLVRAGVGAAARPDDLVTLINQCPEVTTVIPKSDRQRVAQCFEVATASWADLGMVERDHLTERGRHVLPLIVAAAAEREMNAAGAEPE